MRLLSEADLNEIKRRARAGATIVLLAEAYGQTRALIKEIIANEVGPADLPATRKCLRCRAGFLSAHRFNRICRPCRDTEAFKGAGLDG
jgi:hypothetical protein